MRRAGHFSLRGLCEAVRTFNRLAQEILTPLAPHEVRSKPDRVLRKFQPKVLGCVLLTAMSLPLSAFATGMVTLVWNAYPDPIVAGYKIHYGGTSRAYTNEIDVGNATNTTIAGLVDGATYYFAATTYSTAGVESPFSGEVFYLVPNRAVLFMNIVRSNGLPVALSFMANGAVPAHWMLQSSPDLKTWTVVGQGTNLIVKTLIPFPGLSVQFFRLVGQ